MPTELTAAEQFRDATQSAAERVRVNCGRDSADVWRKIPEIIAAEFAPLSERLAALESENQRLREACEEIGAACADVEVFGQLSPIYIPPSNFLVTPTVGYADRRPDFRCDPREVAELIEAPLSTLFDRDVVKREPWTLRGVTVEVPFYQIGPHKVWGATAMILSEFSLLLAE